MQQQGAFQPEKTSAGVRSGPTGESRWTTFVWGLIGLITIGTIVLGIADVVSSLP